MAREMLTIHFACSRPGWFLLTVPIKSPAYNNTLSILVLLNARAVLSSCAHGTYLHRRAADDHKPFEPPNFGYGPYNGPTNWHTLSADYILCGIGRTQSPINVDDSVYRVSAGSLKMHVPVQNVTLMNLGTTLEVALQGKTKVNGLEFLLEQFHFHHPSEHTLKGEPFVAEIHLVHVGKHNHKELAVVSLLVQVSTKHSVCSLDKVIHNVHQVATPGKEVTIPRLNLADLTYLVNKHPLYTYTGSLTTPPCTEGVKFYIVPKPIPMHVTVFNTLKSVMGHNARFLQNNNATKPNVLAAACHTS
ncbi:hypothetical protein RJ035_006843 [Blastomyces gilchristii]